MRDVVEMASRPEGTAESEGRPVPAGGACHAFFAFDVGFAIDLDEAERALATASRRAVIQKKKRAPQSIQTQSRPLRLTLASEPFEAAGSVSAATVDVNLYDFGAASVRFTFPLNCALGDLVALSEALYDHGPLALEARRHLEGVIGALGRAVSKPGLAPAVEDYVVFEIDQPPGASVDAFLAGHREIIARILRAEHDPLSQQEVGDALAQTTAYGSRDAAVIDWHAALLLGPDAEDVRSILEYANVQLVQMRSLDDELERILDASYELLARFKGWRQTFLGIGGSELRRLGALHADSAVLFEAATHSMKLVGDQYLSRVYRAVSQRFHLPQWGANINRKLETIDTIYDRMNERQSSVRMELLEWIIIILILIEVVKGFLPA